MNSTGTATTFADRMAFDLKRRETRAEKEGFAAVRRAERHYTAQLRKVARAIGDIVKAFPAGEPSSIPLMTAALNRYAEMIDPWAKAVAASMLADVSRRDEKVWATLTQHMGLALRDEIRNAPTGLVMQSLLTEQVAEITSIPRGAGTRLQALLVTGLEDGTRAKSIADEIYRSGEVSRARADMLARTGVGTASTSLTQARALHIGSEGYTWRTAGDADVRPSHRKMEGKFVRWDSPPTLDGYTAHCGIFANCRCNPIVQIPRF